MHWSRVRSGDCPGRDVYKPGGLLEQPGCRGEQKFELSHSLVIICPDCGKNIAFRGRCPKCAGNSWIPAGHTGGIFERTKAQRLRKLIADEDVTLDGVRADENSASSGATG